MLKVRIEYNGARIKTRRELPEWMRGKVRKTQRRIRARARWQRIVANGAMLAAAAGGFTPVINIHTSGTSATETVPSGATNCEPQGWGGSGGSGGTTGSFVAGGGSASGSYSRCTISVLTQNGKTFTYTVGGAGTAGVQNGANGTAGGTTTIAAGTVTGFNTMTIPGGGGGGTGGAAGAAGGVPTNTNAGAVNTNGNAGGAGGGSGGAGGTAGSGIAGNVSGDGSPYGAGVAGHTGITGGNGFTGSPGAAVFSYT